MTENSINTILGRLGQISTKLDDQNEDIRDIKADVRKTNGRVTASEIREREREAAAAERRRIESERDHNAEKWRAVTPAIIAGSSSGIAVLLVTLLITNHL